MIDCTVPYVFTRALNPISILSGRLDPDPGMQKQFTNRKIIFNNVMKLWMSLASLEDWRLLLELRITILHFFKKKKLNFIFYLTFLKFNPQTRIWIRTGFPKKLASGSGCNQYGAAPVNT
jgi:hypothetical protein